MNEKFTYLPDLAIHPGETLLETIEALNISQVELAQRAGLTVKHINEIIKGKSPVTPETAIRFERVLGVTATFWNNLEKKYQETIARIKAEEELKQECALARKYKCYKELAKLGYVKATRKIDEKIDSLLRFFGVNSLQAVSLVEPVAFRKSLKASVSKECIAAWLRCGYIRAADIKVGEFNRVGLKDALPRLRGLVCKSDNFAKEMQDICAENGVRLVFVPHFKKTFVNGATRWIGNNPLIQLTIRYKYSDIFWFTFFHELGHVLNHGKKDRFIEYAFDVQKDQVEEEADVFASDILMPPVDYHNFISRGEFSRSAIESFANEIEIAPGVVAGRLAHEKRVSYPSIARLRPQISF